MEGAWGRGGYARYDHIKVSQVDVRIQRHAMRCDPSAHVYTDRADLTVANPHTSLVPAAWPRLVAGVRG